MVRIAQELTDRSNNPDLCDTLQSRFVPLQAQHFTDIGYQVFQVVKNLYPGAYYTKYPATGEGIGIHTATRIYGKAVTYVCKIHEWGNLKKL